MIPALLPEARSDWFVIILHFAHQSHHFVIPSLHEPLHNRPGQTFLQLARPKPVLGQFDASNSFQTMPYASENIINRKISLFYIEIMSNIFFQLQKIFFPRFFFEIFFEIFFSRFNFFWIFFQNPGNEKNQIFGKKSKKSRSKPVLQTLWEFYINGISFLMINNHLQEVRSIKYSFPDKNPLASTSGALREQGSPWIASLDTPDLVAPPSKSPTF